MIRRANLNDASAIQQLNAQELGYDYDLIDTAKQLRSLLQQEEHAIFVAEEAGKVKGYIHACTYVLTYSDPMKDILGIAVAKEARRNGFGKSLLQAVELWGKEDGCCGIRLVSGAKRIEAHVFYQTCGYESSKEQLNFKKWI